MPIGETLPINLKAVASALLCGLLIMLFVSMHTTILRAALSLIGTRTDAAQLVELRGACGDSVFHPAAALRNAWDEPPIWSPDPCTGSDDPYLVTATFTAPHNGAGALFVNDRLEAVTYYKSDPVVQHTFTLRPGMNRVAVLTDGAPANLPFSDHYRIPNYEPPGSADPLGLAAQVWIDSPERTTSCFVGMQSDEMGKLWHIETGMPGSPDAVGSLIPDSGSGFGIDGYRILPAPDDVAGRLGERQLRLARERFYRHLEIERTDAGLLVDFKACLPKWHPFFASIVDTTTDENQICQTMTRQVSPSGGGDPRIRGDHLQATEAVARLYGLGYSGRESRFSLGEFDIVEPLRINVRAGNPRCWELYGKIALPARSLRLENSGFLGMDGDRLELRGTGADLKTFGGEPLRRYTGDAWVWEGKATERPPRITILDWGDADTQRGSPQADEPGDAETTGEPEDDAETAEAPGPSTATIQPAPLDKLALSFAETLPWRIGYAIDALMATLPVVLLLYAALWIRNYPRGRAVCNALAGLALAMITISIQTVLFTGFIYTSNALDLDRFLPGAIEVASFGAEKYAPAAVLMAIMLVPAIRREALVPKTGNAGNFWWSQLVGLGILCVAALGCSYIVGTLPSIMGLVLPDDTAARGEVFATSIGFGVAFWMLFALALSFVLFRLSIMQLDPDAGISGNAFLAAIALVLFPALPLVAGLPGFLAKRYDLGEAGWNYGNWFASGGDLLAVLVTLGLVYLMLRAFMVIAANLSPPDAGRRLARYAVGIPGWLIALFFSIPMLSALVSGDLSVEHMAVTVIGAFSDYGVFIAMIAPITLLMLIGAQNRRDGVSAFTPSETFDRLMALVFAGYLTTWHGGNTFMWPLLLALLGYYAIRSIALSPFDATLVASKTDYSSGERGARLLASLKEQTMLRDRVAAFHAKFAGGEIDADAHAAEIATLEARLAEVGKRFPEGHVTVKRQILSRGPGRSPLENGFIGAAGGLLVALLLKAIAVADPTGTALDIENGWLSQILSASLALDPEQASTGSLQQANPLFALITSLLLVLAKWPVLGFTFGVLFHRIRGDDGFSKALVFGCITAVAILLSFLVSHSSGRAVDAGGGLIGLIALAMLFINILGAFVFDVLTLHRLGLGVASLREIYGIGSFISHASIVAIVTTVQAVFAALRLM